jgi:hypothetical protein
MPALRHHHRPTARRRLPSGYAATQSLSAIAAERAALPLRPTAYSLKPKAWPRSGLTLIEMLMATAITLLMMAAIVNLFATMTASISGRRAVIELNSQLRQVRQRLALDLAGCTVPSGEGGLMPWRQRPGEAIGYLEIIEGNRSDAQPSRLVNNTFDQASGDFEIDHATSIIPSSQKLDPDDSSYITDGLGLGDYDDVLALTVRSLDEPFVADVPGSGRVESNLAEVLWYASETPADDPATTTVDESGGKEPGMRTIYRRVFIIAPWLGQIGGPAENFVSSHRDPVTGNRVANTLADLTRREFRALHDLGNFPHVFQHPGPSDASLVVLSDALAFDVRVYDSGAPLFNNGGVTVQPGDPGWLSVVSGGTPVGYGAYVDLGWNNDADYLAPSLPYTSFQFEHRAGWHPGFGLDPTLSTPNPNPDNPYRGGDSVYDTWTWHYENDGVDQYSDGADTNGDGRADTFVDLARNGIDDDNANGVDDAGERETSPPYPVPLRGVKVVLRTYERDARQVREVSVTNSFVP